MRPMTVAAGTEAVAAGRARQPQSLSPNAAAAVALCSWLGAWLLLEARGSGHIDSCNLGSDAHHGQEHTATCNVDDLQNSVRALRATLEQHEVHISGFASTAEAAAKVMWWNDFQALEGSVELQRRRVDISNISQKTVSVDLGGQALDLWRRFTAVLWDVLLDVFVRPLVRTTATPSTVSVGHLSVENNVAIMDGCNDSLLLGSWGTNIVGTLLEPAMQAFVLRHPEHATSLANCDSVLAVVVLCAICAASGYAALTAWVACLCTVLGFVGRCLQQPVDVATEEPSCPKEHIGEVSDDSACMPEPRHLDQLRNVPEGPEQSADQHTREPYDALLPHASASDLHELDTLALMADRDCLRQELCSAEQRLSSKSALEARLSAAQRDQVAARESVVLSLRTLLEEEQQLQHAHETSLSHKEELSQVEATALEENKAIKVLESSEQSLRLAYVGAEEQSKVHIANFESLQHNSELAHCAELEKLRHKLGKAQRDLQGQLASAMSREGKLKQDLAELDEHHEKTRQEYCSMRDVLESKNMALEIGIREHEVHALAEQAAHKQECELHSQLGKTHEVVQADFKEECQSVAHLRAAHDSLIVSNSDLKRQVVEALCQCTEGSQAHILLEQQLDSALAATACLTAEINKADNKVAERDLEISEHAASITALEAKFAEHATAGPRTEQDLKAAEATILDLNLQEENLQHLHSMEKSSHEVHLQEVLGAQEALHSELCEVRTLLSASESVSAKVEGAHRNLEESAAASSESSSKVIARMEILLEEERESCCQLEQLQKEMEASERARQMSCQDEIRNLQLVLKSLEESQRTTEQELREASTEAASSRAMLLGLRDINETLEDRAATAQQDTEEQQRQLSALRVTTNQEEHQLICCLEENEEHNASLCGSLQEELECYQQLQIAHHDLRSTKSDLHERMTDLLSQRWALQEEVSVMGHESREHNTWRVECSEAEAALCKENIVVQQLERTTDMLMKREVAVQEVSAMRVTSLRAELATERGEARDKGLPQLQQNVGLQAELVCAREEIRELQDCQAQQEAEMISQRHQQEEQSKAESAMTKAFDACTSGLQAALNEQKSRRMDVEGLHSASVKTQARLTDELTDAKAALHEKDGCFQDLRHQLSCMQGDVARAQAEVAKQEAEASQLRKHEAAMQEVASLRVNNLREELAEEQRKSLHMQELHAIRAPQDLQHLQRMPLLGSGRTAPSSSCCSSPRSTSTRARETPKKVLGLHSALAELQGQRTQPQRSHEGLDAHARDLQERMRAVVATSDRLVEERERLHGASRSVEEQLCTMAAEHKMLQEEEAEVAATSATRQSTRKPGRGVVRPQAAAAPTGGFLAPFMRIASSRPQPSNV